MKQPRAQLQSQGFHTLLENKNVVKVLHDCRQGAAALFYQKSISICNVYDTQVPDLHHLLVPSPWKHACLTKQCTMTLPPWSMTRFFSLYLQVLDSSLSIMFCRLRKAYWINSTVCWTTHSPCKGKVLKTFMCCMALQSHMHWQGMKVCSLLTWSPFVISLVVQFAVKLSMPAKQDKQALQRYIKPDTRTSTQAAWSSRGTLVHSLVSCAGLQETVEDPAALLLLARQQSRLLGVTGNAIAHKLSEAHCQWNYMPIDRNGADAAATYGCVECTSA